LHVAWGGLEAVDVFFVLSGLVLSFPFFEAKPPRYANFVAKRTIRIYVPYFVVMTAAVLLMEALLPLGHPHASSWFQQYWDRDADVLTALDYVFMLGNPQYNYVNPVIWSLVHEFRISLIFPVLMWLVRKRRLSELLLASFLLSTGAKLALHNLGALHWWSTIIDTCQYLFFFIAGAELAKNKTRLSALYGGMSKPLRGGVLAGSLLLLNARWETSSAWREVSALCIWAGAILIVAFAFASSGQGSVLSRKPFPWLGHISYSLYLTHCLVLFSALFLLHRNLSPVLIVALVPVISLCVAAGVYRTVEFPALSLARRLSWKRPFDNRANRFDFHPEDVSRI
jgi:peptidoglycan/LPS O-acetylase OafA/YrhL